MINIFFFVLLFLFSIWAINAPLTIRAASAKCDELLDSRDPWYWKTRDSTTLVFDHYRPHSLKAWFGFRHWFISFKENEK